MGHNVYLHIYAVQEANRQYDAGSYPAMMEFQKSTTKEKFRDIVDAIFAAPTKDEALAIIEHYSEYWMEILGNHGFIGKKVKSGRPHFKRLSAAGVFEEVEEDATIEEIDAAEMDAATGFVPKEV